MNLSNLSRSILMRGIDDWVQMCEVANVTRNLHPSASPDEIREESVRAIGELREGGYARIGDLTEAGFDSWTGETSDVLRRVDAEWRALGTPNLGEIGWLENTPVGNRIGLAAWKEEKGEGNQRR